MEATVHVYCAMFTTNLDCPDLFDPVLRPLLNKFPICYQSCSNEPQQH